MWRIAFDLMGNDHGLQAGAKAAKEYATNNPNYSFILVGDKKEILKYVDENKQITILDVPKTIDKDSNVRAARNGDTSMAAAINLVNDGKADVVMSSGNSAAYLAMCTLTLKRLQGIKRPAFMPIFPTIKHGKRFALVDAGANLEVTPEILTQWATLGAIFTQVVLKVAKPKVGLINVGTEENKGKEAQKEAHKMLKAQKKLNYYGFVEPRALLKAEVDVAVVDGYGGNMILKSMEGSILSLLELIKFNIKQKVKYKMGYLLARQAFKNIKDTLDYRNVGSAWLIGLDKLAIKCHGGADKQSYLGAFNQINESLESDLLNKFKEVFYG